MNHEHESPEPADAERARWARGPAGHTAGRYPYQWRQEPGPPPPGNGAGGTPGATACGTRPQEPGADRTDSSGSAGSTVPVDGSDAGPEGVHGHGSARSGVHGPVAGPASGGASAWPGNGVRTEGPPGSDTRPEGGSAGPAGGSDAGTQVAAASGHVPRNTPGVVPEFASAPGAHASATDARASERARWGPPVESTPGSDGADGARVTRPEGDSAGPAGGQGAWTYERARWGRPPGGGAAAGVQHGPDGPEGGQVPGHGTGHGPWHAQEKQGAPGGRYGWNPQGPPGRQVHPQSRWVGPYTAPGRAGGGAPEPYAPEGHGAGHQPPGTREWWTEEASQPFTSESGRRLSPRSMVVGPINQLRSILLPILIGLVIGGFNPWLLAATGATVVILLVGGFVTWQTLRYEITDDRIEIRKGLIRRERRTIPLERIRGVDVTSSLLHRMLGVSVVHIEAAAGSMATEDGKLDAVDAAEADRLRGELLRRRAVLTETGQAQERSEEGEDTAEAEPETVTYFEMPRSWYLFGALSLAHLLTPFALLATAIGLVQQSAAQMEAATDTVVGWIDATDRALLTTLAIGIPVALVLLMPVFAVVSYTVTNWGFTLKGREGSLVAERGLFTRRSVTLEKRRIRGHELQDNPLERTRSAVRLRAIVTGLGEVATRAVLLPTGPRPQVASVVERALARYDGGLRRHPRAALHRRLFRSVGPFLLTGAAGVVLDWNWLVIASVVLAVLGVPLGIDRYRSLGHGYDGAYVSVRSGSLQRGQAVVERSAVIGWTWTQTLFQRRSGLANLQVTVGAGAGGYTAQDTSLPGSVAFAADVTPEMVRPFLADRGAPSPEPAPQPRAIGPSNPAASTGLDITDAPSTTDGPQNRDTQGGESPRTADGDR